MRRQGSASGPASAAGRSLDASMRALFDPRSVTVLGASDDPAKWGHILSRRALGSGDPRPVLLVNRRGADVLGCRTHPTVAAAADHLGDSLDLVLVCVPAAHLVEAVADSVAAGARSLVVITAGLSELGEEGARAEREAVRIARAAGAVVLGPNCLGLVDTGHDLQLSHDLLPAGDVAVISQSGNLVLDLAGLLADRGLGVSRFASVGNQADLTLVDLMASCVEHARTRAVVVYAEDVVDGRAFVATARALRGAGKDVVLMAPGRSAAAVRSAVSHTGSMTSAARVVDAACVAAGVHRVDTPTQAADLVQGLLGGRRMPGRRVAVLTDGGGHGAVASDTLAACGLETPVLEASTQQQLRPALSASSTVANPVDLAGAGEQDPMTYTRALATLLAADEVDGVLLTGYFGGYSTQESALASLEVDAAEAMATLVTRQPKPVAVHTIHSDGPSATALRAAGLPVHRDVDRAAAVLTGLVEQPLPVLDEAPRHTAAPLTDTSYDGARRLFAGAGVAFPAARTVHDAAGLDAALESDDIPFPVVLKALGRVHKSEGGGVVLGLRDRDAARAAYATMLASLAPPAVSVETMADGADGVELIVGAVRDARFGPVLMVGLGGVLAEVLDDTVLALAPVSPEAARRLLLTLRGARLLLGTRGRAPVDLDAVASVVALVSEVAAAHPELAELELNPVLAGPRSAVALDARVVPAQPSASAPSPTSAR
jgi:acyl-CoA synthetase (NDP forming)